MENPFRKLIAAIPVLQEQDDRRARAYDITARPVTDQGLCIIVCKVIPGTQLPVLPVLDWDEQAKVESYIRKEQVQQGEAMKFSSAYLPGHWARSRKYGMGLENLGDPDARHRARMLFLEDCAQRWDSLHT